ncbi:MAG: hypothetical protein EOO16_19250, partial [Chitinophagaceae bacterium]
MIFRLLFRSLLLVVATGASVVTYGQQSVPLPAGMDPRAYNVSRLLAPDAGRLVFLRNDFSETRLYFYNLRRLAAPDSVVLGGSWEKGAWSANGRRLLLYGNNAGDYGAPGLLLLDSTGAERRRLSLPLADSANGFRYKLLNWVIDSAGTTALAVLYSLPQTGAAYESELNSILSEAKTYRYQLARINLESGRVELLPVDATYLRFAGFWKGTPLLLKGAQPVKYQTTFDLFQVDFASGKLNALGAESLLRNEGIDQISVQAGTDLLLQTEGSIYRYGPDGFGLVFYQPLHRSKSLRMQAAGGRLLVIGEAQRSAENELWVLHADGRVVQHADLRAALPQTAFFLKDTLRTLLLDSNRLGLQTHLPAVAAENREIRVQLPFQADTRLRLKGTPYLIEYNQAEWQVIDLDAQLVVYRKNTDDYGQRFLALDGQPYILRYSGQQAEVLRVGEWDRPLAALPLKHAALGTGSSLYQSVIDLKSLAWNPTTQLLSGVFQSDSSYYMALWQQKPFWKLTQVVRLGKEFPFERGSWGDAKERPVSKVECVAAVAFHLTEAEWRQTSAQLTRQVLAYAARWSLPRAVLKEEIFNASQQKGSPAQGSLLCTFRYNDVSGYLLANLLAPERSVYFAPAEMRSLFPAYGFVPLDKDKQVYGFELSDEGNVVILSTLSGLLEYDLRTRKSVQRRPPGEYASLPGDAQFLLEDAGLLLANSQWLDRYTLLPLRKPTEGLIADSAAYDPGTRTFRVSRTAGGKGIVEIRFDRLRLQTATVSPAPLTPVLRGDSTIRFFLPERGYWVHVNAGGIALDTGATIYNDAPARRFRSDLNGRVDFIQVLPAEKAVVIGSAVSGLYECWSLTDEQLHFRLLLTDDQNFVLQAASGYYYATPGAVPQIGLLRGGRGIPAQWLDAELNRPDRVLAELADTSNKDVATLLRLYRGAVEKKAAAALRTATAGAPALSLRTDAGSRTAQGVLGLSWNVQAGAQPLKRMQLYANQVPVWDTVFLQPLAKWDGALRLPLVSGENQLVLVATDNAGTSSLPAFRRVVYAPATPLPARTWVISVAVNRYADTARSLRFAVKDGHDLLAALRASGGQVLTDSLFDEAVTPEALRALRGKLLRTGVEDRVVLSFSGHGMLDKNLDFYYATAPMDFSDPQKYGFSFSELEGLLTGIPARRRLLLIDACNSGNVDKDTATLAQASPGVQLQHRAPEGSRGVVVPKPA